MAARLGVVTGQGLSDLIRDRFGVRPTAFAMIILLIANVANTVAEFSGAAASLELFGICRYIVGPDRRRGHLGARHQGQLPDRRAGLPVGDRGLRDLHLLGDPGRPRLGRGRAGTGDAAPRPRAGASSLLVVAVVGTTITPYMQFYLTSAVAEKGIGEDELGLERADAIGGSIWTNVIAIFIVVAAAATIGTAGGTITSAADAAKALEPVAGRLAEALFAVGLFGASVLAATIMPLSTAFVICEAFGWESGVDKRFSDARAFFSIYTFVLAAGALIVLIPGLDLLPVIIASQNLQGLLLPVVLVFMVLLVNDARLMGAHRNGRIGNVLAWAAVGLVVVLDVVLLGVVALGIFGIQVG